MRTLGILAHVDAGKTTLSERMLWLAGTIRHCGEVEEGLATLDYLPEEQQRGITIQTGIERLTWRGEVVQLLDTPGHIDFGPEVTGVLSALDGSVLVVSGVRHLQTQTLSAWTRLREKKVPVIVFVNRLDLPGSDLDETVIRLEEELGLPPILLSWPLHRDGRLSGVIDVLNRVAVWCDASDLQKINTEEIPAEWKNLADRLYEEALSAAAEEDEEIFEQHLEGKMVDTARLISALSQRMTRGDLLPTYCGSAKQCIGVRQLLNGVVWLIPSGRSLRDDAAVRIVRTRWTSGVGRWYDAQAMKSLQSGVFPAKFCSLHAGVLESTDQVERGEVFGLIEGDSAWVPGDLLGEAGRVIAREESVWGEPLLEVLLDPADSEQYLRLGEALLELVAADPSLRYRQGESGGWIVSGLGEVHLDVMSERLRRDFGLKFRVGTPRVQQRERWVAIQRDLEIEQRDERFFAHARLSLLPFEAPTVALVIEDARVEAGLPRRVLEAAVEEFAQRGVAGSGPLVYLRIIVHQASWEGQFLPGSFKKMIGDLFRLRPSLASVRVEEPFARIEVWLPGEHQGAVLTDLSARGARIISQDSDGYHWRIEARLPLKGLIGYTVSLRSISQGTASFVSIGEEWDEGR